MVGIPRSKGCITCRRKKIKVRSLNVCAWSKCWTHMFSLFSYSAMREDLVVGNVGRARENAKDTTEPTCSAIHLLAASQSSLTPADKVSFRLIISPCKMSPWRPPTKVIATSSWHREKGSRNRGLIPMRLLEESVLKPNFQHSPLSLVLWTLRSGL